MKLSNRQRGASMTGWLMLVMILGLFITVAAKLLPLYVNHHTISTVFDKLATEEGMAGKNKSRLIGILTKKLKINQIRNFPLYENLKLESNENGRFLILEYEERVTLVKNIDLIATFEKEIKLRP